jgi:site-specific recombinase XerC
VTADERSGGAPSRPAPPSPGGPRDTRPGGEGGTGSAHPAAPGAGPSGPPPADGSAPGILTEREWQRILQAAAQSPWPCRDRALLHLLWYFGPTVREVLALEARHLDLAAGLLRWPDGRASELPADALRALCAYIRLERPARCAALFVGRHGRPMAAAEVARLCQRLSAMTGLQVDPAALRRAALHRQLRARPLGTLRALRLGATGAGAGPRPA